MILFFLLVSVMPLTRHPIWTEFIGDLTAIKYLGIACLLYAVLYLGERRAPLRFFAAPQAGWFAAFMATSSVAYLVMGDAPSIGESPLASYISFFGLFFLTMVLIDSEGKLRAVLLAGGASIAIASLYVLRAWQKMGFSGRPGWVTGDPNYFAISALLILPILYQLYQRLRSPNERRLCLACLLVTVVAMTAAASRGGFLGFAAIVGFMIFRSKGRRARLLAAAAVVLILALVSPVSPLERLIDPQHSDTRAADARLALWKAGLAAFYQSPVFGIGPGRYATAVELSGEADARAYNVAHNTYIQLLAEQGVVGFGLFVGVVVVTFVSLEKVRRRTAPWQPALLHDVAGGMQGSIIGYAIAAGFVSATRQKFFWLIVCLSMCVSIFEPGFTQRAKAATGRAADGATPTEPSTTSCP